MPTETNTTALVPVEGEYVMTVSEFDTAGKRNNMTVTLPTHGRFNEWSLMQQAVMLKKGPWKDSPISEIAFGIAYATALGLDIMKGDVFPTGMGRIGTSNKAKIKLALATGNVEGIETNMKVLDEAAPAGCSAKKDIECTATIHVKGWKAPIVKRQRLSQWFKARNPNWVGNPEHMLELSTVAHACEYVNPTATEDDEAPPLAQEVINA